MQNEIEKIKEVLEKIPSEVSELKKQSFIAKEQLKLVTINTKALEEYMENVNEILEQKEK